MPQQLDWQVGDRYLTALGAAVQITAIGEALYCLRGGDDKTHVFDLEGRQRCPAFECVHGDLVSRITGSVKR